MVYIKHKILKVIRKYYFLKRPSDLESKLHVFYAKNTQIHMVEFMTCNHERYLGITRVYNLIKMI